LVGSFTDDRQTFVGGIEVVVILEFLPQFLTDKVGNSLNSIHDRSSFDKWRLSYPLYNKLRVCLPHLRRRLLRGNQDEN
jgi:hypothetical protein